jgi:ribosomal protein S18 acetylase RimI-like enzyme
VETRADNQKAIAFYQQLGFTPLKTVTGYYGGVVDALQMEKRLLTLPQ